MEEKKLGREDILRLMNGLDFLGKEYWITAGAGLVLHGVKQETHDVDFGCTSGLADLLVEKGYPYRVSEQDGTRIFAVGEQVEALENWFADEIEEKYGLQVASLESIRRQKADLGREKDLEDIRRIDDFLAQKEKTQYIGRECWKSSGKEETDMFAVAIDGPAGAGKSSVAKAAAQELGFVYVDTGALYRTVALYLLDHGVDPADRVAVEAELPKIEVGLKHTPEGQKMYLCGRDVTGEIRTPEVSMATSTCSAIPAVRSFLLQLQRDLAEKNNVLMDGRDIGTVVLPHAQLKIFLTASPEERARRRVRQLEEAGQKVEYESILKDIQQRDYQDSNRAAAPLRPAEDSVLLDTTGDTFEESVAKLEGLVRARL